MHGLAAVGTGLAQESLASAQKAAKRRMALVREARDDVGQS